jgi:hypothetical protein
MGKSKTNFNKSTNSQMKILDAKKEKGDKKKDSLTCMQVESGLVEVKKHFTSLGKTKVVYQEYIQILLEIVMKTSYLHMQEKSRRKNH